MYCSNLHNLLLSQSGDIEINPVPMNFCHWNLNGIAANDFVKVTLIENLLKQSETFLDSPTPPIDERLYIKWYSIIKTDHPSHTKRGGVCIYYKEYLPLTRKIGIFKLNECIVTEITVNNERCFLASLYRSPSKSQKQLKNEK